MAKIRKDREPHKIADAMSRSVPEWIGKTDDSPVPAKVKVRVFSRSHGRCKRCSRLITAAILWECDHTIALINGGENRESNLQILCEFCHTGKTASDVGIKAKTYAIQKRHLGLRKPKGRPMPGTRRSGIRKRLSGKVEKW